MSKKRTRKSKIRQFDRLRQVAVSNTVSQQMNTTGKTVVKESALLVDWRMFFRYDPVWIARDLRKTVFVSSVILLVLLSIALLYT